MRAISTVLDASLCLLLVSASAVTLAETPVRDSRIEAGHATGPDSADRTADLLATSTARVTYGAGDDSRRTAHDTLAGLLASATRADAGGAADAGRATADPDFAGRDFARSVTASVNRTLRRHLPAGLGVQVVATEVEPRTGTGDRLVAGGTPPPETEVHAARFELRRTRFTVRTWSA
ncbi:DUF7284 family protein [Halorussus lipolyticus]|uniref:DUF7284 family protein n=1 Tax=Halorussus lipolyticus TaxID=3034024 RepID=UPI0023E8CAC2|nr:hypothetical protein [Halorussus sp. DT80]